MKEEVIEEIARQVGLPKKEVFKPEKHRDQARVARKLACYVLHRNANMPLEKVAEYLNYSSHGSVSYAIKKVEDNINWDTTLSQSLRAVTAKLF